MFKVKEYYSDGRLYSVDEFETRQEAFEYLKNEAITNASDRVDSYLRTNYFTLVETQEVETRMILGVVAA